MASHSRLDTLIALNTALNTLQSTQIQLTRAKNAANTALNQERIARESVEEATVSVSKISPATDPNYEDSLRKAQENLLKKNKELEKILQTKDHEQAAVATLENQQMAQESIIEKTKNNLGASGMVYNALFLEISEVLNQQTLIKQNITLAEAQIDPNEQGLNADKKQAALQELKENLETENQKLVQLEKRLESGEALFSAPKTAPKTDTQTSTETQYKTPEPLLIPKQNVSILFIVPLLKNVSAFYGQRGFRAYLTQSINQIHIYINCVHKTIGLLNIFIAVAWMSLLAPLEAILMQAIHKMVPTGTKGIQWLRPIVLLRATIGFIIGLILALISLPFTTLGAVVSLLAGVFIALIEMILIWILEGLMIVCITLGLLLCSAIKSVYYLIKNSFNRLRGKS
jgi:hypothetical protein